MCVSAQSRVAALFSLTWLLKLVWMFCSCVGEVLHLEILYDLTVTFCSTMPATASFKPYF